MGPAGHKLPVKVSGRLLKQPGGVGPLREEAHVPVQPLPVVLPVEELKKKQSIFTFVSLSR